MNTVRLGVIGLGNIGRHHADYLLAGKVPRARLTAVCDPKPAACARYAPARAFQDATALFASGELDAVIIATPHYQHTTLGIAALEAGLHLMVEKPISAHKADAERLIAVARQHPKQVFAAMFQLRVEPRYQKIRALIQNGDLGEIVRVNWIITDWYRTEAYFASSGWRATWKGEGGGVLLNQCLHNLDTLTWLLGLPSRVRGFCQLGRFHDIEVEDDVTCYLEWPNRATGVFISSTGEAPGTNRLEIAGTRGRLVLENNRLLFTRNAEDMIAFSRKAESGFAKPETTVTEVPIENAETPHAVIMQNFVNAILDPSASALISPGEQGLASVELANAMLYSSLINQTVELPLDGAAYERKLQQLITESRHDKKVVKRTEDLTKSFSR
jgi:predicted dehydrogenase